MPNTLFQLGLGPGPEPGKNEKRRNLPSGEPISKREISALVPRRSMEK